MVLAREDNVKMHGAKVVRAWLAAHPRVQVLWLPKYAAHEVTPVERIWGLMKADVAANRLGTGSRRQGWRRRGSPARRPAATRSDGG
jgi:hypothetical protein